MFAESIYLDFDITQVINCTLHDLTSFLQFFSSISGNPVTTATSIRGPNINRPLLAVPKAVGGPNVNLAVMNKVKTQYFDRFQHGV